MNWDYYPLYATIHIFFHTIAFLNELRKPHRRVWGLRHFRFSSIHGWPPHHATRWKLDGTAEDHCLYSPRLGIPLLRHSHARHAGSKCLGIYRGTSLDLKRSFQRVLARRPPARNQTRRNELSVIPCCSKISGSVL